MTGTDSATEYSCSCACIYLNGGDKCSPDSSEQALNELAASSFPFCFQSFLAAMIAALLAVPSFIARRQRARVRGMGKEGKRTNTPEFFQPGNFLTLAFIFNPSKKNVRREKSISTFMRSGTTSGVPSSARV